MVKGQNPLQLYDNSTQIVANSQTTQVRSESLANTKLTDLFEIPLESTANELHEGDLTMTCPDSSMSIVKALYYIDKKISDVTQNIFKEGSWTKEKVRNVSFKRIKQNEENSAFILMYMGVELNSKTDRIQFMGILAQQIQILKDKILPKEPCLTDIKIYTP